MAVTTLPVTRGLASWLQPGLIPLHLCRGYKPLPQGEAAPNSLLTKGDTASFYERARYQSPRGRVKARADRVDRPGCILRRHCSHLTMPRVNGYYFHNVQRKGGGSHGERCESFTSCPSRGL